MTEDLIQNEESMSVNEEKDEAKNVSEDFFRKKKLKIHTFLNKKRPTSRTRVSQLSLDYGHGDDVQLGFQVDSSVDKTPKVSMRTHLHIFTPEDLHSVFLSLTHTLQTPNTPEGPF